MIKSYAIYKQRFLRTQDWPDWATGKVFVGKLTSNDTFLQFNDKRNASATQLLLETNPNVSKEQKRNYIIKEVWRI